VDLAALRATVAADHEVADRAHDVSHLDRVAALSGWIAEQIGADPVLAKVAGYVHDYHRVAEARTGVRPLPAPAANDLVRVVLDAHQIPRRWYPDILCAVDATGRYRIAGDSLPADLVQACPVAAAVHDADNLDAIGVVGLTRAVCYGTVLGEPLWDPAAALRAGHVDGQTSSIVAHCYEKLVHLADEMLTAPARWLAEQRLGDLFGVLGRLRAELVADPAPTVSWDPNTGYLRVPLRAVPAGNGFQAGDQAGFQAGAGVASGAQMGVQVGDQVGFQAGAQAGVASGAEVGVQAGAEVGVQEGGRAASECRLEFTAGVRLGLRQGLGGQVAVCYVELSALPAVARSILTGSIRAATVASSVRIPVRPSLANRVVAGPAAVSLELGRGFVAAITLHLRGANPGQA
jgi:uncharacterized protein